MTLLTADPSLRAMPGLRIGSIEDAQRITGVRGRKPNKKK
jgi:hypothetical protein